MANLADANVARRLRLGIASLALGLVLAVVFDRLNASRLAYVSLFLPFFLSANSFFQAIFQTCGFSAWFGLRQTDCGSERIADSQELRSVRIQGYKQIGYSVLAAAVLTVAFQFSV